jgi:hypothetical protein
MAAGAVEEPMLAGQWKPGCEMIEAFDIFGCVCCRVEYDQ